MQSKKKTLCLLLGISLLLVLLVALWQQTLRRSISDNPSARRKAISQVLSNQIQPYDSIEKVRELLGPGTLLASGEEHERLLRSVETFAEKFPDQFPDGVKEQDVFLECEWDQGASLQLQFRDGLLINHDPEDFVEYAAPAVLFD